MTKNDIKQYLTKTFITEANEDSTPAIALNKKIRKQNKKDNDAGVKEVGDDVAAYEKASKKQAADQKEVPQNKFNYEKGEKEYHDEMEIMNGMEMVQYDREPGEQFKERALEAIEGSSRMGNNPEWANVVADGWGASPEFGKNLVKKIKASVKKRSEQTPKSKMFGDDWEVVKDTGHKPYAVENTESTKDVIKEGVFGEARRQPEESNTHFAVYKPTNKIIFGWDYNDVPKEDIRSFPQDYFFKDLQDMFGDKKKSDIAILNKKSLIKRGLNPDDNNSWEQVQKPASPDQNDVQDNKQETQIQETMKRLKFKKEFKGVGNALKLIPEHHKVNNNIFEMTDGTEAYRIRWEGTLNEGKAVILMAGDRKMINEDMQKMKHLTGYKSSETLGTVKGKDRITENETFQRIWNKTKRLLEGEDIEDADVKEGGDLDDAVNYAPEAKKHIEGSTSDDKGTQAPAPKTGEWDKIKKPQAADAKKHIQGSTSDDKGTQAPKPKEGVWEKAKKGGAAPEAKEHVKETVKKKQPLKK
jgi:hypothetical protein